MNSHQRYLLIKRLIRELWDCQIVRNPEGAMITAQFGDETIVIGLTNNELMNKPLPALLHWLRRYFDEEQELRINRMMKENAYGQNEI